MELLPELCDTTATPAPYIGGKLKLSRRLARMIDAHPCRTYAEPFVGMGGVFLKRTRKSECEVINDISEDVANFFRILQRHYNPFMDMLRWQLTSRAKFEQLLKVDASTLTDLERAGRFLYLQRLAFGGKVVGRSFGVAPGVSGRFDVAKLASRLDDLHDRLTGVVIERLHFADFIERYDTEGTLFYLDPPYFGGEGDYGAGVFGRDDFQRLSDQLAAIEGRFILSINDTPEIRAIFSGFQLEPVEISYTIASAGATIAKELIITP